MSLPTLQDQITALSSRLSLVDGQGLTAPATGALSQATAKINGLQTDLSQSVLALEGLLANAQTQIAALQTMVSTSLGLQAPITNPGSTVIPPAA